MIEGAYPCLSCGRLVTAWRDNRRSGLIFDADEYDPYRRHQCPTGSEPLSRIASALEAAVAHMDGVWRERERERSTPGEQPAGRPAPAPAGATAGPRPAHLRAVPRADSPPPPVARPVAGHWPEGAAPRPGPGAGSGWGIEP